MTHDSIRAPSGPDSRYQREFTCSLPLMVWLARPVIMIESQPISAGLYSLTDAFRFTGIPVPRWTSENRPLMDTSKPATTAG